MSQQYQKIDFISKMIGYANGQKVDFLQQSNFFLK
jgi:hypothetical protein